MARITHKFILMLALGGLCAVAVTACGNDVPPNAVAKVGDETITQDEFDKWIETAVKGQAQQGGSGVVPDPPEFKKCVAAKQKAPAPEGQKKPAAAELKKQCATEFDTLKSEVMQFLIQAEWVQQEADKRGIDVGDKAVRKSFEDQKKQAFPTDKAYRQFLRTSAMSEADILFRVKLDQLQQKLTKKVTEDAKKVSDADVEEYYEKNRSRFSQPERRDLRVVVTKTEAKANQARQALESGQPWRQVVKDYSIDETSKSQAGKLAAVAKGQQDKAFEDAAFAAAKGELEGPVKTQFGWYVFEVEKVTEASQQSLEQSRDTIRQLLRSEREQKALDAFIKDFREQYKEDTSCSDDYRVAECKNAPKEEKTNTTPPGGAGGGQAPQPTPTPAPQPEPEK